jgi:hypothetical protein
MALRGRFRVSVLVNNDARAARRTPATWIGFPVGRGLKLTAICQILSACLVLLQQVDLRGRFELPAGLMQPRVDSYYRGL